MRDFAVFSALLLVACGAPTTARPTRTAATVDGVEADSGDEEVDPAEAAWARRLSHEDAGRAIEIWSARVRSDEDDVASWLRLAQAQHFVATVQAADHEVALAHAQAGLKAATTALDLFAPDLARAATGHATYAEVPQDAAPALYWYARNLAATANASGYADTLLVREDVVRALSACARVQPEYDHFGATVQLAKRLARPVEVATRDLVGARAMLDRVIAAEPSYLLHRVALADAIGVVGNDRALFERELSTVRDTPLADNAVAEQHIAQARANALLAQVDELFE